MHTNLHQYIFHMWCAHKNWAYFILFLVPQICPFFVRSLQNNILFNKKSDTLKTSICIHRKKFEFF